VTKRTVLIDGDEFIYRASAALEREIRWDEDNHVLYANEAQAWDTLEGMLRRIYDRFEVKRQDSVLCFSECNEATPNFRLAVDPTYKTHRVGARKPMCYAALRERVEKDYRVRSFPGLEADDVMGILATNPSNKRQSIIVSQDKDMKTIPVSIWNGKDLVAYTEAEADYWHMYQTLVGDTADGYKGCPGIGPVKAARILKDEDPSAMWKWVVAAFEDYGKLTEADALVQARLARILRYTDWDRDKKEPVLWEPK
jgi:5'-3' exonuclease